ncbi:MAG: glycosyltransferase family 4 protein [Rhodocyclaceae bacterium]|nr:glycosyltransferase family 4 protein [Rhodocyclaceae bacterium]
MKPRLLVTHAGRQYSHRFASAVQARGWLVGYWSGVPTAGAWAGEAAGLISPDLQVSAPWAPAIRRVLERLLPARARGWGDFLANRSFDTWASRRLPRAGAAVVVGYEAGCLRLFRVAKQLGMLTILDAAAFHHRSQRRWSDESGGSRLAKSLARVKDAELELADFVITTSEFARKTYLDSGFPPNRVRAVPLGADLARFVPGPRTEAGPVPKFCFVGATIERKGIRELGAAMERLLAEFPEAELRVAGAVLGPGAELRSRRARGWVFLGKLRGDALVDLYRSSDALLLPSLEDSFGMVVAEALACGTPALVSDRTGACDLIREDVNGWVVPAGDAEQLAAKMLWIARNLEAVRGLEEACVESARQASWEEYSRRLCETLEDFIRIGPRA